MKYLLLEKTKKGHSKFGVTSGYLKIINLNLFSVFYHNPT
ncbi:hypothetical protein CLU96_0379 [Chryseobacterium sp. 52]|nr:hypothetical protein CLU96_0379 [Chryseobacterium sp. 52]